MSRFSTPVPGSLRNYQNISYTCSTVVWPVTSQAPLRKIFKYAEVVPTNILRWSAADNYTTARYCLLKVDNPDLLDETFWVGISAMFLALFYVLLTTYTSMSATNWDIFRLVTIYNLFTLLVLILILLTSVLGFGFNRIEGFGVLTHNLAEIVLLMALWLGAESKAFRQRVVTGGVMFFLLEILMIGVLPLDTLLLVLATIGVTCDWGCFYTFLYVAYLSRYFQTFKSHKIKWMEYDGHFITAAWASGIHVVTVILLFLGILLCKFIMIFVATTLLVVTFILYTVVGNADSPTNGTIVCGVPKTGSIRTQKEILQELLILSHNDKPCHASKKYEDDEYGDTKPFVGVTSSSANDLATIRYQRSVWGYGTPLGFIRMPGSVTHIPDRGICAVFPDSKLISTSQGCCCVFVLSVVSALVSSFFVWTAPCWIDASKFYGCAD